MSPRKKKPIHPEPPHEEAPARFRDTPWADLPPTVQKVILRRQETPAEPTP